MSDVYLFTCYEIILCYVCDWVKGLGFTTGLHVKCFTSHNDNDANILACNSSGNFSMDCIENRVEREIVPYFNVLGFQRGFIFLASEEDIPF